MPVPNEAFQADDVYIDYPQEFVFFRWHKPSGTLYRRFYKEAAESHADYTSHMFADAQSYGSVTTKERYFGPA